MKVFRFLIGLVAVAVAVGCQQEDFSVEKKQTEQTTLLALQTKIDLTQKVTEQTVENVANLFSKKKFASRSADREIS